MLQITVVIIMLFLIIALILILAKLYRKYKDLYNKEHNKLIGLEQECSRLIEAYNIRKEIKDGSSKN